MAARLPLFPLGTVLVPGEVLPLRLFEPRYLQLARDLLDPPARTPARFGVVALRSGHEVGASLRPDVHEVGCVAQVLEVDRDEDSIDLLTVGCERFRIDDLETDADTPYVTAQVSWLDEPAGRVDPDLAGEVREGWQDYCSRLEITADPGSLQDPTRLSYVVAATMLLHLPERQRLLAAPDAASRLQLAAHLLRRERTLWRVLPSVPAVDLPQQPADPR